jgi:hypothetical protein
MDPNANYERQLELARLIQQAELTGQVDLDQASELAELVLALAKWIDRGGFVPKAFERQ